MNLFVIVLTLYAPFGGEHERYYEVAIDTDTMPLELCQMLLPHVATLAREGLVRGGWGAVQIVSAKCRLSGADI